MLRFLAPLYQGNVLPAPFVDIFGQFISVIHFLFFKFCLQWGNVILFPSHLAFWANTVCPPRGARIVCASIFSLAKLCSLFTESLFPLLLDVSVSLLSLLVTTCGLALFSVSLFVSWKLCWVPLSGRFFPDVLKGAHFLGGDQQPVLTEVRRESGVRKLTLIFSIEQLVLFKQSINLIKHWLCQASCLFPCQPCQTNLHIESRTQQWQEHGAVLILGVNAEEHGLTVVLQVM